MPNAIEELRHLLNARIAEIDAEAASLKAGLRSLGEVASGAGPAKKRTPRKRAAAKSGKPRKRAAKGQRREQVIEAVRKSPGVPVAELARKIGIAPSQAHKIVSKLREEGIF